MMKQSLRLILVLVLSLLLLLSVSPPAYASEEATAKQETVYTVLNAAGGVEKVLVVNRFVLPEAGSVHDYGEYAQIARLTGEAEIRQDKDHISADVPAGEWYYEGELSQAELPWLFELGFTLDGQSVEPSSLSGAEGQFELLVKIKPNPACPEHFRQSFFLQIMLQLESARAEEIRSNAVFQVSAGKNQVLNWLVLPGQEQELRVQAQVHDFALEAPQIAGIPLSFDAASMRIGEEDIKTALERSGGLKQIEDLESAVVNFDEGAAQLRENSGKIKEAIEKIDEGLGKMNSEEQMAALAPAMQAFPELASLLEGGKELAEGVGSLKEGYTEFHQGLSAYAMGMSLFRAGVDGMEEELPVRIQTALSGLFPPYEAESFVSGRNEHVLSVQFVFTWPVIPAGKQTE